MPDPHQDPVAHASASGPERPTISVIIPVYNRYDSLVRALDSVHAQTWSAHEILIVDDGSDSPFAEKIARLEGGRVRIIRHPANRGAAAARNTGLASAVGDYVALLDSDDCWLPNKTAAQLATMRPAPGCSPGRSADACVCGVFRQYPETYPGRIGQDKRRK